MVNLSLAAVVLAGLEVGPGQPSDISGLLASQRLRSELLHSDSSTEPLVRYLRSNVEPVRVKYWTSEITRAVEAGIQPILFGDADYPDELKGCWDAPPILFVRGTLRHGRHVAIVGSRRVDPDIRDAARSIATSLAEREVTVVSGLALGVDTAAHEGALLGGGHTVAVMGTGLDHVYPPANYDLAARISEKGAVISQFAPAAPATRSTFLMRNHIIAGMSSTSILMAAAERSGSRYEAEAAIKYGRRLLLWAPALQGSDWADAMCRDGVAHFVSSSQEVLSFI